MVPRGALTAKQALFLRWASEGMEAGNIAQVESVRVSEVQEALRQAAEILGAASVEDAIVAARGYGIF